MLANYRNIVYSLFWVVGVGLWFPKPQTAGGPQAQPTKQVKATITQLVESSAKFNGKRVSVRASYSSDGIDFDLLMEPNCGRPTDTSKATPSGEPQCARGVVPTDWPENDPGTDELARTSRDGARGTSGQYITADFTGKFGCRPSCKSPKCFTLEIERVENLKIEMKDLKPHRPKDQPNGSPTMR
jgi:hypothetical protein